MLLIKIRRLCQRELPPISISKLESQLGFGVGTIRKWNTSSPTVNKLKAVADYFGVTVDDLIAGDANLTERRTDRCRE